MIYLIHPDTDAIEACGTEEAAQRIERHGYVRVSYARYRQAWQEKDAAALQELRMRASDAAMTASIARIVGRLPGKVYPPFETGL